MSIKLRQNQYKGINAHLHSLFQSSEGLMQWQSFHTNHITDITYALNAILPAPYWAVSEQSLQIRVIDSAGLERTQTRKPDVTILEPPQASPSRYGSASVGAAPTWEATLEETRPSQDEFEIPAVVIYRAIHEAGQPHIPVSRIELLSPSNKAGGKKLDVYKQNRWEALQSGLPLVEIDYLHETTSVISILPAYPHDRGSYPYNIIISDPRLPRTSKAVRSYGFVVDMPSPAISVPLAGEDSIVVAFNEVYQRSFEGGAWGNYVDYEMEPPRMESYGEDDQQRIRAVMQAVVERHAAGQ